MHYIAVLYAPLFVAQTRAKNGFGYGTFLNCLHTARRKGVTCSTHTKIPQPTPGARCGVACRLLWLCYAIPRGEKNVQTSFICAFFRLFIIIFVSPLWTEFLLLCNFVSAQFVGSFCSPPFHLL